MKFVKLALLATAFAANPMLPVLKTLVQLFTGMMMRLSAPFRPMTAPLSWLTLASTKLRFQQIC